MKLYGLVFSLVLLCTIVLAGVPTSIGVTTVMTAEEVSRVLTLDKLDVEPSAISGVVTNRTPHTIRNVQLMIQYHWLWRDERNPGQNPPGRTVMVDLQAPLEPGESRSFSYKPDFAMPSRDDGYFMPEVNVAAFTTVVEQKSPGPQAAG